MMHDKIKCPCCGYYTIESEDLVVVDICDVCLWQYDEVAHDHPDVSIGANKVSLVEARENYSKYGVSKMKFVGQGLNRAPNKDEKHTPQKK